MKTIEVSERTMDYWFDIEQASNNTYKQVKRPKYHAQVKDRPGIWSAGNSMDDAVGNLIRTHPHIFGIEIAFMGKQHR